MRRTTQLRILIALVEAFIIALVVNMITGNGAAGLAIGVLLGLLNAVMPEWLMKPTKK